MGSQPDGIQYGEPSSDVIGEHKFTIAFSLDDFIERSPPALVVPLCAWQPPVRRSVSSSHAVYGGQCGLGLWFPILKSHSGTHFWVCLPGLAVTNRLPVHSDTGRSCDGPAYTISGPLPGKKGPSASMTARAPRYEPPIPHTMNTSASSLIVRASCSISPKSASLGDLNDIHPIRSTPDPYPF